MAAGAESQAGVQHQLHPRGVGGLLPLRHHQQAAADLHGLVKLLPVVLPVLVGHVGHGQQQGRVLRVVLFQRRHGHTHGGHGAVGILVPFQIERHAADALLLRQQVVIHIIPVLAVVLQKALKVRLVVDHHAGNALLLQHVCHRVQARVARVDLEFQPVHRMTSRKVEMHRTPPAATELASRRWQTSNGNGSCAKTRRGGASVLCVRQAAATKYWRKRRAVISWCLRRICPWCSAPCGCRSQARCS